MRWTCLRYQNEVQKTLLQILPNIICWHFWKYRCTVKCKDKEASIHRVQYAIFRGITHVLIVSFPNIQCPHTIGGLISLIEQCKQ